MPRIQQEQHSPNVITPSTQYSFKNKQAEETQKNNKAFSQHWFISYIYVYTDTYK